MTEDTTRLDSVADILSDLESEDQIIVYKDTRGQVRVRLIDTGGFEIADYSQSRWSAMLATARTVQYGQFMRARRARQVEKLIGEPGESWELPLGEPGDALRSSTPYDTPLPPKHGPFGGDCA
jgi:hypothetical protein